MSEISKIKVQDVLYDIKDERARDYTAYEVTATDVRYAEGEYKKTVTFADKGTFELSNKIPIPASMTEELYVYTNSEPSNSDVIIDWGDGTVTYGENTHTYTKAGTYVVKGKYWFANANLTWRRYITKLIKGTQQPVSVYYMFSGQSWSKMTYADFSDMTLTSVNGMIGGINGASAINVTEVIFKNTTVTNTSLNGMFKTAMFESIDLSGITFTKNIADMAQMFQNCTKLKRIDLTSIDMRYVTTINGLVSGCTSLEDIKFPYTEFITCGIGTTKRLNVGYAFQNLQSLKKLDLSMLHTQIEPLGRIMQGSVNMEEFDFSSLVVNTNHLGYSFPDSYNILRDFKYFKRVEWATVG